MEIRDENLDFEKLRKILFNPTEYAQVGKHRGLTFEVRTKEQGHNVPHCHVLYNGTEVSISLVDFKILAGNIRLNKSRLAVEWVKENIDILRKYWNDYHSITV